MSKKQERLDFIEGMLEDGKSEEDIIDLVTSSFDVSESTVKRDLKNFEGTEEDEGFHKEGYEVPKGEEEHIHAQLEMVMYNTQTGKKTSKPFIQKYDKKGWINFLQNTLGYKYEVLYAPVGVKLKL